MIISECKFVVFIGVRNENVVKSPFTPFTYLFVEKRFDVWSKTLRRFDVNTEAFWYEMGFF